MAETLRVQVVGAGSWGLALTRLLALNGHDVRLWCREEDGPDVLRRSRRSPLYLPNVSIPDSVLVEPSIDPNADVAVLAAPSHIMRRAVKEHRFGARTIRVNVAKGIENETLMLMHEVIRDVCGDVPVVTLSGPSHAEEVGLGLPASVVAASVDAAAAELVQRAFMNDTFRVYTSSDVIGVQLGGSLKNVIAVAAGICDGLGLGDSARAALITRGLAEMSRLGVAMRADPLTFAGLSGMGDLIVTCASVHSRNHALGERIAAGMTIEAALAASPMVAEGYRTAKSAHALAEREGVEMPITDEVHSVLYKGASPQEAVLRLMTREPKPERK